MLDGMHYWCTRRRTFSPLLGVINNSLSGVFEGADKMPEELHSKSPVKVDRFKSGGYAVFRCVPLEYWLFVLF